MRRDKVFHVISNTHWDREWRFPFQRNRMMLVEMIDKAIEILENNPEYRAYHLDSQSIVVEDYLQIRPENKQRFINLVKQNRLLIGPWYVLPDEFLVGGENLIRNLLLGHKVCAEHGGVSKIGYSPFSWGQISQLPQLYREFGINLIMFYRGMNSLDSPKAEFIWEGADGTKALSSRFSTMPRYNFYFYIYRPVIHNETPSDVEYKWTRGGTPFHFSDTEMHEEDYFTVNPVDEYFRENIKDAVESIVKNQADDFTSPHVIWMEGHDSSGPNEKTVQIIQDIQMIFPDIILKHSTLEQYAKLLADNVDTGKLSLVKGERRSSQYDMRSGNLYGYTTSARMYLKQKNYEAEKWLQFYAEPFANLANLQGSSISQEYLKLAWNFIIQNSSHDSIGGCSLDEIHDDMMNRYKHSIEISKGVLDQAYKKISASINTNQFNSRIPNNKQIFIVVFNPNTYEREEVVQAFIDVPEELAGKEIEIRDQQNSKIELQVNDISFVEPVLEQLIDRPMYFKMKRHVCCVNLKDIPSLGYKTLQVIPLEKKLKQSQKPLVKISKGLPVLENEFLKIQINRNGTFTVFEKACNKTYENLGYFYDEGEAGHAWVNKPTKPFLTTLKLKPQIKVLQKGHLSSSISIKYNWKIPMDSLTPARSKKKPSLVDFPVEVFIILTKVSKRVDLKVKLNNTAENHRLRMMFPTNLNAEYSYGEGQFDVVKRPIKRIDAHNWVEQPMYDYPLHHFVDISDGGNGCAIIAPGLKEYEVLEDPDKTVALTLLRAFTYIIYPSSKEDYSNKKGSQCLGEHKFNISFYPHKGLWDEGNVYEQALNFSNDLRLIQIGSSNGNFAVENSFLKIEPCELVFSCFKKAEFDECYILRVYNPTGRTIDGQICFHANLKKAEIVTLEEKYSSSTEIINGNAVGVEVGPKKIITLKIFFLNQKIVVITKRD